MFGTNGISGSATLGEPVQGTVPRLVGALLLGTNGTSGNTNTHVLVAVVLRRDITTAHFAQVLTFV